MSTSPDEPRARDTEYEPWYPVNLAMSVMPPSTLQTMVCDVMLWGWVLMRSPLWRGLHRNMKDLLYFYLTRRYEWRRFDARTYEGFAVWIPPHMLIPRKWVKDLPYRRRPPPRGLVASFEHPFYGRDDGRDIWLGRGIVLPMPPRLDPEMHERFAMCPGIKGLSRPRPVQPPRGPDRPCVERRHAHSDPTRTHKDQTHRNWRGRIVVPRKRRHELPRKPDNVAWKKGLQTGQRRRGK
jgi:hypothetical protein